MTAEFASPAYGDARQSFTPRRRCHRSGHVTSSQRHCRLHQAPCSCCISNQPYEVAETVNRCDRDDDDGIVIRRCLPHRRDALQ
jgi:hypothetical protein